MTRFFATAVCALLAVSPAFAQSLDVPDDGTTSPGFGASVTLDTQESVIPAPETEPQSMESESDDGSDVAESAQQLAEDVQEAVVPTGKRYEAKPSLLSLQAGLGVNDYRGELSNNVETGLSWDLRGGIGNDRMIGGELAFTGAMNDTTTGDNQLGANVNRAAIMNTGDAQARLNITTEKQWQPYVAAGLGFMSLDVRDKDSIVDDGNAITLPLSAGVQFYTKSRLSFGGRFNYRVLTDIVSNDIPSGDQWNLGFNVGATF